MAPTPPTSRHGFLCIVTRDKAWIDELGSVFGTSFGRTDRPRIALAPGRVNLIGEHTDYNDGWVLPMAIDRRVGVAVAPRDDRVLRVFSVEFEELRSIRLDETTRESAAGWISYVAGAAWALTSSGHETTGADLVIDGDVPVGSGLSSSSALVMATLLALCEASGIAWSPVEMTLLGGRVEKEWVGVQGGLMDQYTATMARKGHALLLDCRELVSSPVPMPDDVVIVVMDTGVPRTLVGSSYNERSASCREAVGVLRAANPEIRALRDVELELLEAERSRLDDWYLRKSHI